MSSKYVMDTVWTDLQSNWVETRLIDVENLYQTNEVAGDPLTEYVTLMPAEAAQEEQVSLGAPGNQRWRESGILGFVAMVPSGTGTDRPRELAEMLRERYRAKMLDDGAGGPTIVFLTVSPPDEVLPSAVNASSGGWFGYAVGAEYYVDTCK